MTDELKINRVPLDDVLAWPRNPKRHDHKAIRESIEAFGFKDPIAVNRRNMQIEEGHGRVETLKIMRDEGVQPPDGIVTVAGVWQVPVLFFDDETSVQEAYGIAHNRVQDLGGGYDPTLQIAVLEQLGALQDGLKATGFSLEDAERLRRELALDASLQRQSGEGETVECPSCHEPTPKYGSTGLRSTCEACGARLDGEARGTMAPHEDPVLKVDVTPEQAHTILAALDLAKSREGVLGQGSALTLICSRWLRAQHIALEENDDE